MKSVLYRSSLRKQLKVLLVGLIAATVAVAAWPQWQRYSLNSMINECMEAAKFPQLLIEGFHQREGRWPDAYSEASVFSAEETLSARSAHCMGLAYDVSGKSGSFTVSIYPKTVALEESVSLQPRYTPRLQKDGSIVWHCSSGQTDPKFVKHLPPWCRSQSPDPALATAVATTAPG